MSMLSYETLLSGFIAGYLIYTELLSSALFKLLA